jgi:hypothetical protein
MFEKLLSRFGYTKAPEKPQTRVVYAPQKRSYAAAAVSNLLTDWTTNNNSADIETRLSIRYIRNRTRDLERNDDYANIPAIYFQSLKAALSRVSFAAQGAHLSPHAQTHRRQAQETPAANCTAPSDAVVQAGWKASP